MKKKRGFSIQINFSNRWLYTFIAIGILMIIGVGVYALAPGIAPNPGHLIDNVAPPADCASGQVLGWDGSAWGCVDASAGGGLDGYTLSISGDRWGVISPIGTDGVMEVGKYIDFHESDADTGDHAVRLTSSGGNLIISGGNLDIGLEYKSTYCHVATSCKVYCSSGKKVIGGGCSSTLPLQMNHFSGNNAWYCLPDTRASTTAYAICARVT